MRKALHHPDVKNIRNIIAQIPSNEQPKYSKHTMNFRICPAETRAMLSFSESDKGGRFSQYHFFPASQPEKQGWYTL
jgi:hypothetical protein